MNKIIIVVLLLISTPCFADNFVCWDSNGLITQTYTSIDGSTLSKTDCMSVENMDVHKITRWQKVVNRQIVDMSQTEIDAILLSEQQAEEQAKIDALNAEDTKMIEDLSSVNLDKVDVVIDNISNLAGAKTFLKKLVRYLAVHRCSSGL